MTEDSALIKRMRALLAKASDPGVTEAEAEAFGAKVQELLARHNMSEADLAEKKETIGAERDKTFTQMSSWRINLYRATCLFYMCRLVKYGSDHVRVVGTPSNAAVAREMYGYFLKTTTRLAAEYLEKNGPAPGFAPGRTTEDFKRGCSMRIAARLDDMRKATMDKSAEWKSPGNPGNLPALMQSQALAVKAYAVNVLGTTKGKARNMRIGDPGAAGWKAGESVGLNTQLKAGGGRLAIGKGK